MDKQARTDLYQLDIQLDNKNDSRAIIYDFIPPGAVVLDIGCACGDLGVALKRHKRCLVYGLEYNEESVDIAKNTKCYEQVHQTDLNFFDTNAYQEYHQLFDFIIFGDVLEHLYHPQRLLEDCKLFLKKNGHIIISLPNIAHASIKANLLVNDFTYTPNGLLDNTHIRFFTHKTLSTLLAHTRLAIEALNYTVCGREGTQPVSPYKKLSNRVKRTIFSDEHSFVFQYILLLVPTESSRRSEISLHHGANYTALKRLQAKNLRHTFWGIF